MKRWFLMTVIGLSLGGCATSPPGSTSAPTASQDANGVPVEQTYRAPRANIGIGIGRSGGRGFGGVGIGLGF